MSKYEVSSGIEVLYYYCKRKILEAMSSSDKPCFVRSNDSMSLALFTDGNYQKALVSFISEQACKMNRPSFIDIGANVGLISAQVASVFEKNILYEPNTLLCHIIHANMMSLAPNAKYTLHNFALGEESKIGKLTVPPKNVGGAFIGDSSNSYDKSILALKDAHSDLNFKNYNHVEINIVNAEDQLALTFQELAKEGLNDILIKIDTEGYELVILRALSKIILKKMNLCIIFESWDKNLSINYLKNLFPTAKFSILKYSIPYKSNDYIIVKGMKLLFASQVSTIVADCDAGEMQGEVIIQFST
jgi:FkbM family methyltransferase